MSRKKMEPGTHGAVSITKIKDGRAMASGDRRRPDEFKARVYYVDQSGTRREATVRGKTSRAAEDAVLAAVESKLRVVTSSWSPSTRFVDACRSWVDTFADDAMHSPRSVRDYRGVLRRCIESKESPVRSLTLSQANDVQVLQRFVQWAADTHSLSSVHHLRAVVSGTLGDAVRFGVLPTNALRDVKMPRTGRSPLAGGPRDTSRSFTRAERDKILARADARCEGLRGRSLAKAEQVSLLLHFLAGTGCRLHEALLVKVEHLTFDKDGRVTHVYIPGKKSSAADRTVNVPGWLSERLADRRGTSGYVLHSPALRDRERPWELINAGKAARAVIHESCPWAGTHTFRKTVATLLWEAGAPQNQIADVLGHTDASFTASTYLGRAAHADRPGLADLL